MEDIRQILEEQRKFSAMSLDFRLDSLRALFSEIKAREPEICAALRKDLGKCEFEAVATETSVVLEELSMMIKHLPDYVQRKRVGTSLLNFCSKGYIYPEPLGNVLIFSAWNYPFQLMISPLIGAVAAGNRVILKPAEQAEATAGIIESIVKKVFQPAHVHVFNGGVDVAIELLKEKFDYIFYTGGAAGGKAVMRAAAEKWDRACAIASPGNCVPGKGIIPMRRGGCGIFCRIPKCSRGIAGFLRNSAAWLPTGEWTMWWSHLRNGCNGRWGLNWSPSCRAVVRRLLWSPAVIARSILLPEKRRPIHISLSHSGSRWRLRPGTIWCGCWSLWGILLASSWSFRKKRCVRN